MKKEIKLNKSEVSTIEETIGEIYQEKTKEEVSVNIIQSRKFPKIPDFILLFQAINLTISKNTNPITCKILLYFMSKLQYGNHIGIDNQTICEEIGCSKRSVSRALKDLTDMCIIIQYPDPQDHRRNIYIINPTTCWKGTVKEMFKTTKLIGSVKQLSLKFENDKND
jgi:predicted transcriptional regulator